MRKVLLLAFILITLSASAQTSPNGLIRAAYVKGIGIKVSCLNQGQWQEVMTLSASCGKAQEAISGTVDYQMILGKQSHCTNAYNQATYPLIGPSTAAITVRVYNDGVAWSGVHDYQTHFDQAKHYWIEEWSDAYEGFFPIDRELTTGQRMAYPALFEYDDGIFALLSESDMTSNLAASSPHVAQGHLAFDLIPEGPEPGGWQTLIIGSLANIVESTLITDNSAPCKLTDTSWIEPGVASWVYWAYNHGSDDYDIICRYVDMAARLHLPYVLIDAEWDQMKNGHTIEEAVAYARQQGIKPMIWYNSSIGWVDGAPTPKYRLNTPADLEREFAWCESIGVAGVKVDFFSGDSNQNMKFQIELIQCAARHHMLINFHGATIPRGWQRTYPNLVSTEGVYGAEWYNNKPILTNRAAAHNATLPFTRNVVGSMDYTPCAFSDSQHPHITSHAHELALTVLFESGIQHLADRPESFYAQPLEVQQFLGSLPTTWDETRLLSGYPGQSVVLARRKGDVWYIAGINGLDTPQELSLGNLADVGIHGTRWTFYLDGDDPSAEPWLLSSHRVHGERPPYGSITCRPRGGFVIRIYQ